MNGLYNSQPMTPLYPSLNPNSLPTQVTALPTSYNPAQFYANYGAYPNGGRSAYNLSKKPETKSDTQSTQENDTNKDKANNGLMNFYNGFGSYPPFPTYPLNSLFSVGNPFFPLANMPTQQPSASSSSPSSSSSSSSSPSNPKLNPTVNPLSIFYDQMTNSTLPNLYSRIYPSLVGAASSLSPNFMLQQPYPGMNFDPFTFDGLGGFPSIMSSASSPSFSLALPFLQ